MRVLKVSLDAMTSLRHVPACANKTGDFREAVKRVNKRQLDLGEILKDEQQQHPQEPAAVTTKEDKPLAKKPKNGEDEFESKGRSIVENVSRLNRFLADNRHAYVDVLNNEWNPDPITDLDR